MLLASVRDIISSLHRMTTHLDREVSQILHDTSTGPAAGELVVALQTENHQLKQALEARAMIEQAKGMLMAQNGCSADRAFELLVAMSQAEQRKVRDIAAEIVAAGRLEAPAGGADPTLALVRPAERPPMRIDLAAGQQQPASSRRRSGS
jgi:ANTAR domain